MIQRESLYIKNMLCSCCFKLIENEFNNAEIKVLNIQTGSVEIEYDNEKHSIDSIEKILQNLGMGLLKTREQQIVSQIKQAVIELIHYSNNVSSILRKSDYLVEKLNMSYQQLSKIFSKHENITLERYIIRNKIERIKELIDSDEYSLSEIAYMMDYSSVQYLSNQFKKETGFSVSEYKKFEKRNKSTLDELSKSKN